jgi:hypothetical protein
MPLEKKKSNGLHPSAAPATACACCVAAAVGDVVPLMLPRFVAPGLISVKRCMSVEGDMRIVLPPSVAAAIDGAIWEVAVA